MANYLAYTDIRDAFNFTNATALPNTYITPSGGIYTFSYNFLVDTNSIILTEAYDTDATGQNVDSSSLMSLEYISFSAFNSAQKVAAERIMHKDTEYDYYYSAFPSDVTSVVFSTAAPENAHITFGQSAWDDNDSGTDDTLAIAYTKSVDPDGQEEFEEDLPQYGSAYSLGYNEGAHGDIWLNSIFTLGWGDADEGSWKFWAILHELGHSLGLMDLHKTPGTLIDDQKYTVMSYELLDGMDNSGYPNDTLPSGLQLFDILALQSIYGSRNYDTRDESTIYAVSDGFGATDESPFIYTIWDGGGVDEIDASAYDDHVKIDLRQGFFSSIGAAADSSFSGNRGTGLVDDNVAIAFHTIIENATGTNDTDDGDTLIGNGWGNELIGLQGDDFLFGDGWVYDGEPGFTSVDDDNPDGFRPLHDNDILNPGIGVDEAYGGLGNDTFIAAGLLDELEGDIYHGGGYFGNTGSPADLISYQIDGTDTVDYSGLGYGVNIVLDDDGDGTVERNIVSYSGGVDEVYSIERFLLTEFDDWVDLYANTGEEDRYFDFGDGNDWIYYRSEFENIYFEEDDATGDLIIWNPNGVGRDFISGVETLQKQGQTGSGFIVELADTRNSGVAQYAYNHVDYSRSSVAGEFTLSIFDVGTFASFGDVNHTFLYGSPDFIVGTNHGDYFDVGWGGNYAYTGEITIVTGTGDDFIQMYPASPNPGYGMTIVYTGGDDTYDLTYGLKEIYLAGTIVMDDITDVDVISEGNPGKFIAEIEIADHGTLRLEYYDTPQYINLYLENGGSLQFHWGVSGYISSGTSDNPDELNGTWGDDVLSGRDDEDETFYAKDGDDHVFGGDGDDTLYGGDGDDHLHGEADENEVYGGRGNDHFYNNGGEDIFFDIAGHDVYQISALGFTDIYDSDGVNTLIVTDIDSLDFEVYYDEDTGALELYDISIGYNLFGVIHSPETFSMVQFDDGYTDFIDLYFSVAGEDVEISNTADYIDFLYSERDVSISLLGGDDEYDGGNRVDVVWGGAGEDQLIGGAGDDALFGGDDDDYLVGGQGNDRLDGGASDYDVAYYGNAWSGIIVDLMQGTVEDDGQGGSDTLTGIEVIYGSSYDDQITGGFAWESLYGGNGNDTISGRSGSDAIQGQGGNDIIDGGIGDDYLDGGDGDDLLIGGEGDDFIVGGNGIDTVDYSSAPDAVTVDLDAGFADDAEGGSDDISSVENIIGSAFGDILAGDDGVNRIAGGTGDDEMQGGAGADIYVYSSGDEADTVTDTSGDADTIEFGAGIEADDLDITETGTYDLEIEVGGVATDTITIIDQRDTGDTKQIEFLKFADGSFVELAGYATWQFGTGGGDSLNSGSLDTDDDVFFGLDGDDFIVSWGGNDYLIGGAGDDVMLGNSGDDHLFGGEGEDTLVGDSEGETGSDYLAGGTGDDSYYYVRGGGIDTIFDAGSDTVFGEDDGPGIQGFGDVIVLENTIRGDTLVFTETGTYDLEITFTDSPGDKIILLNHRAPSAENRIETLFIQHDLSYIDLSAYGELVSGTSGAETMNGDGMGAAEDHIWAAGGNDIINGHDQDDTLNGGEGSDVINGGAGDDLLFGGKGDDVLQGGPGDDLLDGSTGNDTASYADDGAGVTVDLSSGSATDGNSDTDELYTIENVIGSAYNDDITGDENDNILTGGEGDDILAGGDGDDGYGYAAGDGADQITDTDGNADYILFTDGTGPDDLLITNPSGDDLEIEVGGVSTDTITIFDQLDTGDTKQVERVKFADGSELELAEYANWTFGTSSGETMSAASGVASILIGLEGNDTLNGHSANDILVGGEGNDTLVGNGGADEIYGGAGNDVLRGITGNDILIGGDGDDDLDVSYSHTAGDDILVGGYGDDDLGAANSQGNDIFYDVIWADTNEGIDISLDGAHEAFRGGDGNNTFYVQAQDHTLSGYGGDDTYKIWFHAPGLEASTNTINETGGDDTLILANLAYDSADWYVQYNNDTDFWIVYTGTAANSFIKISVQFEGYDGPGNALFAVDNISFADSVTIDFSDDWVWQGTTGNDLIATGSADDFIAASHGTNTITSGAGDDWVFGGDGVDIVDGEDGNDYINGWGGNDDLSGGDGNDRITGDDGDDLIYGEAGVDFLYGGDGEDEIYGGDGDDHMHGNQGDDLMYGGTGEDVLVGSAGNDTLYGGADDDTLNGSEGNDIIYGEDGNDVFEGGDGDDTMYGGAGNDIMYGESDNGVPSWLTGNDTLYGGDGNDNLWGGVGDDILYGQNGADTLRGQEGADTFMFEAASAFDAVDTMADFNTGQNDKIDISDVLDGFYEYGTDDLTDFVEIITSGANSQIRIDTTGTGTFGTGTHIATIGGVTGLTDEVALETSGALITH